MSAKKKTKVSIDADVIGTADAKAAADAYSAPELVEVGTSIKLVQGIGWSSGYDCRYSRFKEQGPYGC